MTHIKNIQKNDTICAPACASANSALSIIRLSGPSAHQILRKIFCPTQKSSDLCPRKLYFGRIYDGSRLIDEVMVHIAVAPASFTGEDTAEISCHGSSYIVQEIMRLLVQEGAVPAGPGAFSQRAFLNGKMDLAQAEAIADLIASENQAAHHLAVAQMKGGFSKEIRKLRSDLVDFASLLELELDFSEEDLIFADRRRLLDLLDRLQGAIQTLCDSFSLGNVLKNGLPVAIIGPTNAGKSTLLNALTGEERAIVSEVHGTTRDTIEEEITLDGIRFRFIDTAGLREAKEEIERMGIERSYQKIRTASLLLLVLDASQPESFGAQIQNLASALNADTQLVIVLNKSDKVHTPPPLPPAEAKLLVYAVTSLSAKFNRDIDELKNLLTAAVHSRFDSSLLPQDAIPVTNLRHVHALRQAQSALDAVREGLKSELPTDLIVQDLRQALHDLGSITGEVATKEILENIFAKFCIGK
ncbi:MAG: tRNA uridine-5-carboxymethylaminomethyl(34) synthesis GTPase MnmE [Bacteroidales bacterium]|nr:tRNA uridine-5-carboxymethylaminomethyl(34) synthesis GTPase MnmE [Bacteroidales bacterium]